MKALLFGGDADANLGLLVLRVFAGAAMLTHGVPKLFGGLDGFTKMVAGMNLPAPAVLAFLAALSETLGALFLALGLLTRLSSALLTVTMAVAAFVALAGKPFGTRELALFYLCAALVFLCKGGGKWSVDALLR